MTNKLKQFLARVPGLKPAMRKVLVPYRMWNTRRKAYRADIRNDRAHIGWYPPKPQYWKLSSELIFWHHKLEKGLCLPPGARPFFGDKPARITVRLLQRWKNSGFTVEAPVYQGALATLEAYRDRMASLDNPQARPLIELIKPWLADRDDPTGNYTTPIPGTTAPEGSFEALRTLAISRRSTRDYTDQKVDPELVDRAAQLAQLSPSACNRQPWKVHLYDDPAMIEKMMALQNGNRGFGHTVPLLAVITADLGTFFDASERMEPVLDGGLFLMSFILGLQAQGLASCCLNWCVKPEIDVKGHQTGNIPSEEKILTYLAIGHPRPDCMVPRSPRRPLSDVLYRH